MCNNSNSEADADIDRRMQGIWLKALNGADVKPDDDFIQLGGNSLRAMHVITLVREEFGVEVALAKLLDARSLREFCLSVAQLLRQQGSSLSEDDLLLAEREIPPGRGPNF